MNATLTRVLVLAGLLLVLGAVNYAIARKERVMRTGESIYLELAPVDPRSLMQGDYMALRFELSDAIERSRTLAPEHERMRAPVALDARRVAHLATGGDATLFIRYRIRNGGIWLGTNAYFFEEGTAARYADARYGEFKVDRSSGEAVLVGLRDAELRAL